MVHTWNIQNHDNCRGTVFYSNSHSNSPGLSIIQALFNSQLTSKQLDYLVSKGGLTIRSLEKTSISSYNAANGGYRSLCDGVYSDIFNCRKIREYPDKISL